MIGLAEIARQFWCAAFFIRRGQDRDKSVAVAVLQKLKSTTGPVQSRAEAILKEHNGE